MNSIARNKRSDYVCIHIGASVQNWSGPLLRLYNLAGHGGGWMQSQHHGEAGAGRLGFKAHSGQISDLVRPRGRKEGKKQGHMTPNLPADFNITCIFYLFTISFEETASYFWGRSAKIHSYTMNKATSGFSFTCFRFTHNWKEAHSAQTVLHVMSKMSLCFTHCPSHCCSLWFRLCIQSVEINAPPPSSLNESRSQVHVLTFKDHHCPNPAISLLQVERQLVSKRCLPLLSAAGLKTTIPKNVAVENRLLLF